MTEAQVSLSSLFKARLSPPSGTSAKHRPGTGQATSLGRGRAAPSTWPAPTSSTHPAATTC